MNAIRFNLFGFPVIVAPQFWVLAGVNLLYGLQTAAAVVDYRFVAVVFVSILIHELGHALSCRRFSLDVLYIQLHGFGGEVLRRPGTHFQNLLQSAPRRWDLVRSGGHDFPRLITAERACRGCCGADSVGQYRLEHHEPHSHNAA